MNKNLKVMVKNNKKVVLKKKRRPMPMRVKIRVFTRVSILFAFITICIVSAVGSNSTNRASAEFIVSSKDYIQEFNNGVETDYSATEDNGASDSSVTEVKDVCVEHVIDKKGSHGNYKVTVSIRLPKEKIKVDGTEKKYKIKDVKYLVTNVETDVDMKVLSYLKEKEMDRLPKKITAEKSDITTEVEKMLKSSEGKELLKSIIDKNI